MANFALAPTPQSNRDARRLVVTWLFDVSESMGFETVHGIPTRDQGGRLPITVLEQELPAMIKSFGSAVGVHEDEVDLAIGFFRGWGGLDIQWLTQNGGLSKQPTYRRPADYKLSGLKLEARGTSPISNAIKRGLEATEDHRRSLIRSDVMLPARPRMCVFTDGLPEDDGPAAEAREMVKEYSASKVRTYGLSTNPAAEGFLREVLVDDPIVLEPDMLAEILDYVSILSGSVNDVDDIAQAQYEDLLRARQRRRDVQAKNMLS